MQCSGNDEKPSQCSWLSIILGEVLTAACVVGQPVTITRDMHMHYMHNMHDELVIIMGCRNGDKGGGSSGGCICTHVVGDLAVFNEKEYF